MKRTLGILGVLTVVGGCRVGMSGEEYAGAVAVPEGRDGGAFAPDRPSTSESGPAAPPPPGVKDAGPGPGGNASIDGPLDVRLPVDSGRLDSGRLTDASSASQPGMPPGDQSAAAAGALVFSLGKIHQVEITIAPADILVFEKDGVGQVPCTLTFDGVTLAKVRVSQGGAGFHGYRKLRMKPSFNLKTDEYVPKQNLDGIDKLTLKNEVQDFSFLNEHLTYEVWRRAGLPSRRSSWAVVTVNGFVEGIYLVREAVDGGYLKRTFGKLYGDGNLYEGSPTGDLVDAPDKLELKHQVEEMRQRNDINALAAAIRTATDANFVATVSQKLDFDQYMIYLALEAVTAFSDGFSFNINNFYLYNNPKDNRFVLIPHGADQNFGTYGAADYTFRSALQSPRGKLSSRVRAIPVLDARFKALVMKMGQPPVWDQQMLLARVALLATLFKTIPNASAPKVAADLSRFATIRPKLEMFITTGGLSTK